ncbi:MAG: cupin domain-containing protein [Paenibacillaceae bacterium]|nr:cupin domain-containing protein [Paenibacillaceae bacterium]
MDANLTPRVLSPEEGQHLWYLNGLVNIRLNATDTGGQFCWVDELLPVGSETPYHLHRNEDETFYVVDGDVAFVLDGRLVRAKAGDIIFLPKKIPHGFRVIGDRPARLINLVNPSGFEQMFTEAGEPAATFELPHPSAPDISKVVEACMKLGVEILGPLDPFMQES